MTVENITPALIWTVFSALMVLSFGCGVLATKVAVNTKRIDKIENLKIGEQLAVLSGKIDALNEKVDHLIEHGCDARCLDTQNKVK